ncbi:hypothetical protein [Bradyrhizobium prioriisuperbiae]|uniref:hypothetical protein n=1 Tax=Bradyrhizobium prioriisuperbiae TaxID=2854389 RepID=UPI0028E68672|nr:hypothetical protein [Bradyrhizobium prioritasuperba]
MRAAHGVVSIRRHDDGPEYDVIVVHRGKQLVLRCPDYRGAVQWARVECKSYRIPENFPDIAPDQRSF